MLHLLRHMEYYLSCRHRSRELGGAAIVEVLDFDMRDTE